MNQSIPAESKFIQEKGDGVTAMTVVVSDVVTDRERAFPFLDLLKLEYFQRYRLSHYRFREKGFVVEPRRNYCNLLRYITEIHGYSQDDAKSFAKKLRDGASDWRNGEATFAEIIVYRYYLRPVHDGMIRSVRHGGQECDVIVELLDGSRMYLEVLSIRPNLPEIGPDGSASYKINTHTQDAKSSIRQKLLHKIQRQKQMSKPRENYAVIELNDVSIVGDFHVLSSLSEGYKIQIGRETKRKIDEGFDWKSSLFHDDSARHLKGVIWFDLGDYESRRILYNPFFTLPRRVRLMNLCRRIILAFNSTTVKAQ